MKCAICNRPLKSPKSIAIGMGASCAKKERDKVILNQKTIEEVFEDDKERNNDLGEV